MKYENPKETTASNPTDLGLTSTEVNEATAGVDELNLTCSDFACHIATNEFELVSVEGN